MTTVRGRALLGLVGAMALFGAVPAGAADNAAHSIADKFAHDTDSAPSADADADRQALERKLQDEDRLKADEADMLSRAKAEAAELKAGEGRAAAAKAGEEEARAAEARRTAEEKRIAEETAAQERAAKDAADRAAKDAESQRLATEKADAERRAADEAKRVAEEKRKAEEDLAEDNAARERATRETARIKEADTQRLATEKADAERHEVEAAKERIETARQADDKRRMEADREEEARRLSEKLTRAREQRAAKELGAGYSALGNPPEPEANPPGAETAKTMTPPQAVVAVPQSLPPGNLTGEVAVAAKTETRATILLVMEPGTRGIRRYEKSGDPIICIGEQCYIGNGAEQAASMMTRGRAFGPGNTLGQRAGACRHSLVCVFRDVEVGAGAFQIQPIDLRILRHDRRETKSVEVDSSCTAAAGYLRCSKGLQAASYRLWVVPESVAHKAGAGALSAALSSGLSATTAAELQR